MIGSIMKAAAETVMMRSGSRSFGARTQRSQRTRSSLCCVCDASRAAPLACRSGRFAAARDLNLERSTLVGPAPHDFSNCTFSLDLFRTTLGIVRVQS